jgi:IS30 family transposase
MQKEYTQLTEKERQEIARTVLLGWSSRAIGRLIQRAHSTVLREIHRHQPAHDRYRAEVAQARADRRRHQPRRPRKLAPSDVRQAVVTGLAVGWSPEAVAGRLTLLKVATLSRGPIYRLLRDEPTLPHRRGPTRHVGVPRDRIHHRTFLDQRPAGAQDRTEPLHFEGDTLGSPQAHPVRLATATCRTFRYTVLARVEDRSSARWRMAMAPKLRKLGCRSLTIDNGMEFASHRELAAELHAPVYFAHPGCPWERGTNEHHNGLLRWWIPKGTDIGTLSDAQIQVIEQALNDRPRKQLGWQTPAEKMAEFLTARAAPLGGREGSAGSAVQPTPTL